MPGHRPHNPLQIIFGTIFRLSVAQSLCFSPISQKSISSRVASLNIRVSCSNLAGETLANLSSSQVAISP